MSKLFDKFTERLIFLYIILLPWQTAYIFDEQTIGGIKSQYLSGVFFATEILFAFILLLSFFDLIINRRQELREKMGTLFRFGKNDFRPHFIISLWLLIAYLALSILWSGNQPAAFYQFRYFLEGAALLFIIQNGRISPNTIFTALFLSGILPALLSIYQFTQQDVFACKWLGLASHAAADSGSIVIEAGGRWLRAYGPFAHPNVLGGWLSLSFLSGLILLSHDRVNTYLRRAIIFISPLITAGIFFSFSRSAWLALLIAAGLFIYFERGNFRRRESDIKYYPAPQIIFAAALFIILSIIFSPLISARTNSANRLEIISTSERADQLSEARQLIFIRPLSGAGLNNYTASLSGLFPSRTAYGLQPVHNIYLLMISELGLIGSLLFLSVIISAGLIFIKHKSPKIYLLPMIFLFIVGLLDHYPLSSYLGIILVFISLSVILNREQLDNQTAKC